MKKCLIALISFIFIGGSANAEFVGTVKLVPDGCQETDFCTLAEDFGFIDRRGIGWVADAGNKTDGASIPKWAQRFVGIPFTPQYLNAAVLHDHYSKSERPVRGWFETQRMFHEALLETGVSPGTAGVLYAGVLIGSGKWIIKMTGKPCDVGEFCVNTTGEISIITEAESFGSADYEAAFHKLKATIESSGELDADQIEALVRAERPDSIFMQNPSGIIRENLDDWPWAATQER